MPMGSSDVSDPWERLFRHVPLRTYQGSVTGLVSSGAAVPDRVERDVP